MSDCVALGGCVAQVRHVSKEVAGHIGRDWVRRTTWPESGADGHECGERIEFQVALRLWIAQGVTW